MAESKSQTETPLCSDLAATLSDIGRYSYATIVAYSLHKLFDNDKSFVTEVVSDIVLHLKLNQQVKSAMSAIALGNAGIDSADVFVTSLQEEDVVKEVGCEVIVHDLVLFSMRKALFLRTDTDPEGCYDARLRVLVRYICLMLRVHWNEIEKFEDGVIDRLQEEEHVLTEEEEKEQKSKDKKAKIKRYALIGLATVGGGTLIGLTGGLAAPLLAAGAGAVIGTAGAAALGSTAGVAIIGSLFGVAGAGLTGYKMKKRVGGVEEFEFEPLTEGHQLHVTLAVSGWLHDDANDFRQAWRCLCHSREQYVLRWESRYLREMGTAMDYLYRCAINAAAQEALKYTILSGILTAVAWPATLLTAASVIDNPWSVCTTRATAVGKLLAQVLLARQQGKRPVTLVGFSLGARVIFYCLKEMAKSKQCAGVVEDVILLGAPVSGNSDEWSNLSKVVSGRIVNGYCRGDWLLKFLYRTASVQLTIAGLAPVKWTDRRMHNIDLSDLVTGHSDYMLKIGEILDVVGIQTKQIPTDPGKDSLKQWVRIQKASSSQSNLTTSKSMKSSSVPDLENYEKLAVSQSGLKESHSGPTESQSGPKESQSGLTDGQSGPTESQDGPTESRSGPTESRSGPTESHSGPKEIHSGRTESYSGLTESHTGPTENHTSLTEKVFSNKAAKSESEEISSSSTLGSVENSLSDLSLSSAQLGNSECTSPDQSSDLSSDLSSGLSSSFSCSLSGKNDSSVVNDSVVTTTDHHHSQAD